MNVHCKSVLNVCKKYREPLVLILVEQTGTDKIAVYGRSVPNKGELRGFYRLRRVFFQKDIKGLSKKIARLCYVHRYNPDPAYEIHFEKRIFKDLPEVLERYKPVNKRAEQEIIKKIIEYGVSKEKIYY